MRYCSINKKKKIILKNIGKSGGVIWWRVCYRRGLPRQVFRRSVRQIKIDVSAAEAAGGFTPKIGCGYPCKCSFHLVNPVMMADTQPLLQLFLTVVSKTIFEAISGTLEIKKWNSWNYSDLLCVMCEKYEENIEHFMTCEAYGKVTREINWREVFENNISNQNIVAKEIKKKKTVHKKKQT